MKFTDENGDQWESTTSEYGNGTQWIRRIPRREKSNAEIAKETAAMNGLETVRHILDAVDAKFKAKFKEVFDAVDAQERRLLKAFNERVRGAKLEGGK